MAVAKAKWIRISPRKARLVADTIRGLPVERALDVLRFNPKKGAILVKKVLESAIANAEHNEGADVDELVVTSVCVNEGARLRRFHPRAKGRGFPVIKPTSHIEVQVGILE